MQTSHNRLNGAALYLGDNGRCFCGTHAGVTAQATGRDLSGQRVHKVTEGDHAYMASIGSCIKCETCTALAKVRA
jgi:hypothetical protein